MNSGNWRSTGTVAAVSIAIISVAAYVSGYWLLSTAVDVAIVRESRQRRFSYEWQARIYVPIARLESLVIGKPVTLTVPSESALPLATPSTSPASNAY